jgi:hypothetical protein
VASFSSFFPLGLFTLAGFATLAAFAALAGLTVFVGLVGVDGFDVGGRPRFFGDSGAAFSSLAGSSAAFSSVLAAFLVRPIEEMVLAVVFEQRRTKMAGFFLFASFLDAGIFSLDDSQLPIIKMGG